MKNIKLLFALTSIAILPLLCLAALAFFLTGDLAAGWGAIIAVFLLSVPTCLLGGWALSRLEVTLRDVVQWRSGHARSVPKVKQDGTVRRAKEWPLVTTLCFIAAVLWSLGYGCLCLIALANEEWQVFWPTLAIWAIPAMTLLALAGMIRHKALA